MNVFFSANTTKETGKSNIVSKDYRNILLSLLFVSFAFSPQFCASIFLSVNNLQIIFSSCFIIHLCISNGFIQFYLWNEMEIKTLSQRASLFDSLSYSVFHLTYIIIIRIRIYGVLCRQQCRFLICLHLLWQEKCLLSGICLSNEVHYIKAMRCNVYLGVNDRQINDICLCLDNFPANLETLIVKQNTFALKMKKKKSAKKIVINAMEICSFLAI